MALSITLLILSSLTATSITASPQDFLDAHNRARVRVGVPPLVWNDAVSRYAAEYARRRSGDCRLEHSRGPYGENLAEGWGQMTAADAVGMWVEEKPCYDYGSNACVGGECRHYTQVVWNHTVRVGCGGPRCRNGWVFVVCDYDLPGNYVGRRPY